ncbi:PilC family type IV pilus tip adhesin [Neisseria montereyensis]|uniref:PilC family type IV pilus tip adhesin n=1 Tax=Neisseria montereyensis TaxID=2973938 RepID=A0ABT2FCH2_9NEIS|nr:PilC family type IV pilus tip adhesin [Neisseria montereyensis]MCS4533908.1 PilC family type IV pilus tip adhesin [Neisseria montereyensis]
MKKTSLRLRTSVRPIIYSLLAAFPLLAAGEAAAQFADTPLYLQKQTTISGGAGQVKPNVMLLIDDSGSMQWVPEKDGTFPTRENGLKSRMQITQDALKTVVNKYTNQINWGFQTLNNNSNVNLPDYTDDHSVILNHINRINPGGGTPTTRRYYEVSNIVRNNTQYRCQQNYIVVLSDGDANLSCDDKGNQIFNPSDSYFTNINNVPGQCVPRRVNPYHSFWDLDNGTEPAGLRFLSQILATKDFKTSGTDLTGKSWNGDPADPKDSSGRSRYTRQIVETYTVGFGSGLSQQGRQYLEKGASQAGYFYNASNEDGLIEAFQGIFNSIENQNLNQAEEGVGTSAPAITGNSGNNNVPDTAVTVQLDPQYWSSQLRFYNINADRTISTSYQLPYFGNRKTLINNGQGVFWADDFNQYGSNDFFGLPAAHADEWQAALMPWTIRSKSKSDATIKSESETTPYSQTYRDRNLDSEGNPVQGKRDLGDILDSGIATIGDTGGNKGRQEFLVTAANDGMVHLFQRSDLSNYPYELKLSYIPAAMERDPGNGGETLGKTLKEVAAQGYGTENPHRYMVNGGFVVRRTANMNTGNDADTNQRRQVVMFGAMGQGGRGAYALQVGGKDRNGTPVGLNSNSNGWNTQVPLFETEKGENNTLGYTVGTPQIGRVSTQRNPDEAVDPNKNVRYAAFMGSGYRRQDINDSLNETALYVYDLLGQEASTGVKTGAAAGTVIQKISVPNGVGGLSSPTLLDIDFDGIVDIAYAGDYGGNMYRFDLRGKPTSWKVTRIFTGDSKQPITAAPAVSRRGVNKYVVIFGTGSDVYQSDLDNKDRQAVYGIFEDLTYNENAPAEQPATAGDLLEQTFTTQEVDGQSFRFLSNNLIRPNHKGWKISLGENDGERIVIKPTMILRTAVLSTRVYSYTEKKTNAGDVCLPETTEVSTDTNSWILAVNAETGGGLKRTDAHIDFIQRPVLLDNYYANGQKKSGIVNFSYVDPLQRLTDSAVTLDGDSGGNGTDSTANGPGAIPKNQCFVQQSDRFLALNTGETPAVQGRNCVIRRISWREIF